MQSGTHSPYADIPVQEAPAILAASATRKVSLRLGIGIFVLPFLFSWFTLRPGYGKKARVIAFAWLFVYVLIRSAAPNAGSSQQSSQSHVASPPAAATHSQTRAANRPATRRESREEQMARWINEIRAQGGQCVMVGNFVEQYVNQFGVNDWKVTKALEMASDKGCF